MQVNIAVRAKRVLTLYLQGANAYGEQWPHTKDHQAFLPGGDSEAIGRALLQLKSDDPPESRSVLWGNLKSEFQDVNPQLSILEEIESASRSQTLSTTNIPFEFGGAEPPEVYPTLVDAKRILGVTLYLWLYYIMRAGLVAIAGDVGCGKTILMMDLHRRQYFGLSWPDGSPILQVGRNVLWLMADQRIGQLVDAAENMNIPLESVILASEYERETAALTLDNPESLRRLDKIVRDTKPYALVIDTFTSAMGVKEHHKPEVMNPITSYLLDIAQTYQIPVILLCHTNSEGGIYGKALSRKCEHQLALVFSNKHDITSPRNLKCIRSRHIEKTRTFGITYENHVFSYGEPHEMFDDANHAIQTRKESKADQDIAGMALILEKSDAKGIAIAEATSALKSEDRSEEAARKAAQRALQALCERGKAVKHEQKWYAAGFEPDSVA